MHFKNVMYICFSPCLYIYSYWNGKFEDSYWMKRVKGQFYEARMLKLYQPSNREDFIVAKEVINTLLYRYFRKIDGIFCLGYQSIKYYYMC